jgi:hypothetical protein
MAGNAHHSTVAGPAERIGPAIDPIQEEFDSYHQPGQRVIDESHIRALAQGLLRECLNSGGSKVVEKSFMPSFARLEEGQIVGGWFTWRQAKHYVRYMDRRDNQRRYEASELDRRRQQLKLTSTDKELPHLALAG